MEHLTLNKQIILLNPCCFIISMIIISVIIRTFNSFLKTIELYNDTACRTKLGNASFVKILGLTIVGFSNKLPHPDYLFNYILGLIELLAFPVLLQFDAYTIIGAWFGFKTLAQWSVWKKQRNLFNRFLIGNALVLILSYIILKPMIVIQ